MLDVFTERDKACKWSDQRARATDIHAEKQLSVILGKLWEQYRRRNVTDELTGYHAHQKRAPLKQGREKISNGIDPCHIPRKDEEKHEGQKQRIINHSQCPSIHYEQRRGNDDKPYPIRNQAENDYDREREKNQIDNGFCGAQIDFCILYLKRLGAHEYDAAQGNECDRNDKRQRHYRHKLARGNIEFSV